MIVAGANPNGNGLTRPNTRDFPNLDQTNSRYNNRLRSDRELFPNTAYQIHAACSNLPASIVDAPNRHEVDDHIRSTAACIALAVSFRRGVETCRDH